MDIFWSEQNQTELVVVNLLNISFSKNIWIYHTASFIGCREAIPDKMVPLMWHCLTQVLRQCFISIPSENDFLTFWGGIELKTWAKMGQCALRAGTFANRKFR